MLKSNSPIEARLANAQAVSRVYRTWTIDGVTRTAKEWAEVSDLTVEGLRYRLKSGMTMEEAIATPRTPRGRPRRSR